MRFWLWFIAALAACYAVARPGVWAVAALAVFVFGLVWSDGIRARVKRKQARVEEELAAEVERFRRETVRLRAEVAGLRERVEDITAEPDAPEAETAAADVTIG